MADVKAIITAAGEGRRLRPYTELVKKELITIKGIPLIGQHIDRLKFDLGVKERDICVVVGYMKDEIIGFIQRYYPDVKYVEQEKNKKGTAVAVSSAADFAGKDWTFIIYGDVFTEDRLRSLVDMNDPVIVVKEVEDVSRFGNVSFDEHGYMTDIQEKLPNPISGYAFAGFLKEPYEFFKILDDIEPNEKTGEFYLTDAIKIFNTRKRHRVYKIVGHWSDVGTEEAVREARNFK
ncbi:MAG: nucleotidyltransferase family protein [Candidatus Heimdallarchaeota archaeon]